MSQKLLFLVMSLALMLTAANCTFKFLYRTSSYNTPATMPGGEHTDFLTIEECKQKTLSLGGNAFIFRQSWLPFHCCYVYKIPTGTTPQQFFGGETPLNHYYDNYIWIKLLNPVCQASSKSVPNSWCQTYCTFGSDGVCNGVQKDMQEKCECNDVDRTPTLSPKCYSIFAAVPNDWCGTYCHIDEISGSCSVDVGMQSICACNLSN